MRVNRDAFDHIYIYVQSKQLKRDVFDDIAVLNREAFDF